MLVDRKRPWDFSGRQITAVALLNDFSKLAMALGRFCKLFDEICELSTCFTDFASVTYAPSGFGNGLSPTKWAVPE